MSRVYIVASLPRTGTTSLCEMAEIVGLKPKHLSFDDFPKDLEDGFNFFADTPFFDPGYLTGLFQHHKNIRVIYSMRDLSEIDTSWDRFGLTDYLKGYDINNANSILEVVTTLIYRRAQVPLIREEHHDTIKKLCQHYNVPFLE